METFYLITLFKGGQILFFTTLKDQVKDNWEHFITSLDLNLETQSIFNCCVHAKSLQSSPTRCAPIDYSLPGCSVHGILQTRILEWVAVSFSRGSSQPRDQTLVSCIADRLFTL